MLVTRQFDSGRHTWSTSKLGSFNENTASSRMSNLDPSNAQPDWREQYPQYLPPTVNSVLSPHFEHSLDTTDGSGTTQRFSSRPALEHRHSTAQLGQRHEESDAIERPESAPPGNGIHNLPEKSKHNSLVLDDSIHEFQGSSHQTQLSNTANIESPILNVKVELPNSKDQGETELKEEDDDDLDDEMFDAEDTGGAPQTEAERRAERRKLKRFRLTHQQTRFLMSEFSRQAHPDAAHRERLSREIPGLSSRQVQVWFQNRRAKIKRLNADDRDRMMKMRAVPEDFDNAQALHSPYGAIHAVNTPMISPMDYGPNYGDQSMMRPLMVDTMRRHDMEEHMSPTGISPAFNNVGFAPTASVGTPDVLSPLSLNSADRYYSSHLSSPMSGPRSSNPFLRQSGSDNYGMNSQNRNHARPLQPLHLRETVSRSRSESLQSPLRSSMSWKGDSLDYGNYDNTSPTLTGRQQSLYQPDQNNSSSMNLPQYPSNGYNNNPSQTAYPTSQPAPSSSIPSISRFRASSSAYPPSLELRNQYRNISTHSNSAQTPITPNHPSTPRHSSFASPFASTGFQSAPLLAPTDFQLPRTPIDTSHPQVPQHQGHRERDFSMSQLSAPIAPPQDFNYQSQSHGQTPNVMSPERLSNPSGQLHGQPQDQRRDDSDFPAHPTQSSLAALVEQAHSHDGSSMGFGRDGYSTSQEGDILKRKRTYSMGSYQTS